MLVLIIAGRYGGTVDAEGKISITRNEYRAAKKLGIPIFTVVNNNVIVHGLTYSANKKKPENKRLAFEDDSFPGIDSLKVFDFVDEVKKPSDEINQALDSYNGYDDIELYIKQQWAGLMQKMLDERRRGVTASNRLIKQIDLSKQNLSFESQIIFDGLPNECDTYYIIVIRLETGLPEGSQVGIRFASNDYGWCSSYKYSTDFGDIDGDGILCGKQTGYSSYEVKFNISSSIGRNRVARWEYIGGHLHGEKQKDRGRGIWCDTSSYLNKIQVYITAPNFKVCYGEVSLYAGDQLS